MGKELIVHAIKIKKIKIFQYSTEIYDKKYLLEVDPSII